MALLDPLRHLHGRVQRLPRLRARAVAFALGLLAVLSMPPLYQFYVLIPAFSGLLWLSVAQPSRWQAFAVGWWFGGGFFTAGLYWISFALLVDAEKFAWLMPIAIFGFAIGLGLFCAVVSLAVKMTPGGLTAKALVLGGMWTVLEWVRSWLFTGLPWNPLGSAWLFSDTLSQGASVIGALGLSLLAVLVATAPGALVGRSKSGPVLLGTSIVLVALFGVGGQARLSTASNAVVPDVRLRLVQPNISQSDKWKADQREAHMLNQLDLASQPPLAGEPSPTHVIWAETSAPFFLANHNAWRNYVGSKTPAGGLMIIGAPRVVDPAKNTSSNTSGSLKVANSLLAINARGDVVATYDKFHLVPFGEYVPLSDWLPLDRITQGVGAFTPGPGPQTLKLKGLPPVSPLICYEIIFPATATDGSGRAEWILNLTNDAWYGKTAGPHQHFVSARLRAIEQGVPVVRVAGTGISGIIDAYGRVRASLALGEKGFVDGDLPRPTATASIYARFGDIPALILAVLLIIAGLGLGVRHHNRHGESL